MDATLAPDEIRTTRSVGMFVLAAIGLLIGVNHPLFLTCESFDLAGSHVPTNCTPREVLFGP